MRTPLSIDDDLMSRLKTKDHTENKTLTCVVNEVLRSGFDSEREELPFVQETVSLGGHPGIDLTKALDLAAELETSYTVGKVEIGK